MACTTTKAKDLRPQPLQTAAKQVSTEVDEYDPMDPIAWNLDTSAEAYEEMALLNVVELEQGDLSRLMETSSPSDDVKPSRKRTREEEQEDPTEGKEAPQQPQGEILPTVSLEDSHQEGSGIQLVVSDDRPRVSRRKKKPKSLPKRPLGAYGIFYHQERQRIVESLTEGSLSEDDIQRQVGKLWRGLAQEDIKRFEQLAEQDKARYHAEMQVLSSPQDSKTPSKNNEGYYSYGFPPPPPGVMVIPAQGSNGSEAGSVAAAAGMKEATPTTSPVPPPTPPRWGYPGSPVQQRLNPCYPSPVPSVGPHVVQSSPYPPRREYVYYPPPSPRSWTPAPPSPYQRPPPPRTYSPHFGRPARPAYVPPPTPPPRSPHHYSIPPGMELALPHPRGGEQKYRVSYMCYRMRAEDVQGFLESMTPQGPPPPPPPPPPQQPPLSPYQRHPGPQPPHQPSYGPPHW